MSCKYEKWETSRFINVARNFFFCCFRERVNETEPSCRNRQPTRQCAASLGAHVNPPGTVLARVSDYDSDYETTVLQGRRRQQMVGAFCASTHFPRTLIWPSSPAPPPLSLSPSFFRSCSLFSFSLSGVKFTNPYGAPRASNERFSLTLSSITSSFLFSALDIFSTLDLVICYFRAFSPSTQLCVFSAPTFLLECISIINTFRLFLHVIFNVHLPVMYIAYT